MTHKIINLNQNGHREWTIGVREW